ncbi:hypothetical protein Tco_0897629, partial [Tanacetum coccineum]
MDDLNITMEEYIRLEEEKAHRRALVYNDALTSEVALSYEPMVSPLNDNQIDFRISFDESDDEDYMIIYDKISFSYKIISFNDLKTDSENDNDKVNMPSFSLSEPTVELTVSPQHIDEFNLKNETSLSECDSEEQNVIYFNDLFPFNVIYPNNLKSDKDNDDDNIDIKQFSKDNIDGRHKDLERSCTSRKSVAPTRNRILVYPDSDEEYEIIGKDNIDVNTAQELEEVQVEDVEMDEDCDIDHSNTKVAIQWSHAHDPFLVVLEPDVQSSFLLRTIPSSISNEIKREFKISHRYVFWKPSQEFTRLLGPPSGLKGLLHTLNATVIPTKVTIQGDWMLLVEELDVGDSEHGLEHAVSSLYQANPG